MKNQVLEEISKGKVVSGGLLASKLGVSRTAVWKAVNALRADGYFISGLGGGYVLSPENRRLCGEQLRFATNTNIVFFEECVSTNEEVKSLAQAGEKEFTIAVARKQTGGKGRLGRRFFSEPGGLYFSALLRPKYPAEICLKITTAAAVAMAEAIEKTANLNPQIKWVNDIYINNKKVCGILTEGAFDAENSTLKYAVLGVGVNVSAPKDGFPAEIAETAGALFETRSAPSLVYCALLDTFLKNFKEYYEDIEKGAYLDGYRKRSMLDGKTVTYIKDGKEHKGTVLGIGDGAQLIIKEKGRETELVSGEVSITRYE